jgi:DNA-binding winged helix-turn-helix (wHTH) protein/tetratricopeptide (TPR) repeat protein
MQNSPEIREYRFGAYRLSNQQQSLFFEGKTLSLSTKIYYLLLTLVKNAGQVLSKDEIIEAVWPGQIVTDAALTKQVLRLRTLLQDQHRDQPFIETHRGVGYRFTPPVEIVEVEPPLFTGSAPPRRTQFGYVLLLVALLGVYFLSTQLRDSETDPQTETNDTVNLAVLQMGSNADWLNLGGVEYLSDLISDTGLIYAVKPDHELLVTDSSDENAVNLTNYENINYSCLLDVSQKGDQFLVRANLRNKDGIVATTEIETGALPLAFEKTRQWIQANLPTDTSENKRPTASPTQDEYALQSYLQGLLALKSDGDYQKAAEYFRAAVNSDPDFLQAWAKLARSLTDIGNQDEALSIGLTLLENPLVTQDDQLNVEVNYVVARAYNRKRDGENAALFLSKTRDVIATANNPYVRLDGLESLSLLAQLEGNIEAAEAFGVERLALASEFYPIPNYLASIHLQIASLFENIPMQEKLREHATEAIRLSELGQNPNGMIAGYRYLNTYNFSANRLDEGVQVSIQARPFLEQSSASYDQAFFLQFSTMILSLRGRFDLSENYSNRLRDLALESSNSFYEVLGDFTVLHRLYVNDQFLEARAYASAMRARFMNDAVMRSALPNAMVIEATVSARIDDLDEAIRLLTELEEKFSSSTNQLRNDLNRARGHIAVRQGQTEQGIELLFEAEQAIRAIQQQSVANYIGYEILEILLENPNLEYQSVIDRLERHTDYDYHFLKLKAQFKAREGNFLDAAMLMQENRLRANQLWKPEDQLLLESFQQLSKT